MWMITDVIPISELRKRQDEVLAMIERRPVILTQHGRGAAVLISLAQWESILERLEDMDDALTMIEARLADTEPAAPLDEIVAELTQDKVTVA
jgi:prevent-host-death family protein